MSSFYKKILDVAKENKIEVIDLEVAYEVSCCLNEDISDKKFDEVCNLVKDTYLKYEELTLWSIVNALLDMAKNEDKTLETFDLSSISRQVLGDKASYYL